jgi:hypothetical protein
MLYVKARELCYGPVGRLAPCPCIERSNDVPLHELAILVCASCGPLCCVPRAETGMSLRRNRFPRFGQRWEVSCGGHDDPLIPVRIEAADRA